jgi:hypothetical protein
MRQYICIEPSLPEPFIDQDQAAGPSLRHGHIGKLLMCAGGHRRIYATGRAGPYPRSRNLRRQGARLIPPGQSDAAPACSTAGRHIARQASVPPAGRHARRTRARPETEAMPVVQEPDRRTKPSTTNNSFTMRRRAFITLLSGAAAWPVAARAQQAAMPVIGLLNAASPDTNLERLRAFRLGLEETGYVEGDNVTVLYRWAEGHLDRLPGRAADLARRRVTVLATFGNAPAFAAKAATTTVPVIFAFGEEPVRSGLVASLARPGGNLTGVNFLTAELGAKRLELLRELVPGAVKVAVLVDPAIPPTATTLREVAGMPRGRNRRSRKTHATIAAFRVRFARAGRLWLALLRAAANPCFSQLASGSLRPQYVSFPCRRSHTHSGCPPDAPWPRCAPSAASGDDSLGSEPRAVRLYGPASHSPSSPAASANRTGHLRRYRGALATCIGS